MNLKITKETKKNIMFTLILVAIGMLGGFFSTGYLDSGFKYTKSYFVYTQNLPTSSDAEDYTDTAVAILQSNDFLNELKLDNVSLTTKKIAPYVITVSAKSEDITRSTQAIENLEKQFNDKAKNFTSQEFKLNSIGTPSSAQYQSLNNKIMAVVGALLGLLSSLVLLTIAKSLDI